MKQVVLHKVRLSAYSNQHDFHRSARADRQTRVSVCGLVKSKKQK